MNKVYKRFFDELDSHEIEYFANIDKQFTLFSFNNLMGKSEGKPQPLPCMKITLKNKENHDFFLYLESLNLIYDFKYKEPEATFFISAYFTPYFNYYLKNIKNK